MQCYLVVRERSVPYIRRILDFLHTQLSQHYEGGAKRIIVANSVDEAGITGPAIVYYIGERLGPFTRRPGCFYVFFNFSVVAMIGNPFVNSLSGLRLIRQKRWLMDRRIEGADAILDHYPAQTRVLQRKLSKPVFGFLPCGETAPVSPIPLADRDYDVCFVGGMSPRRERVLRAVKAAGLSLSPTSGHDLEDLTARSRCTLNIHMQASNHLEIPRVLGALSTASPVVSEYSYGLEDVVNSDSVLSGRARALAGMAADLIADPDRLARLTREAPLAYAGFVQAAKDQLETSLASIDRLVAAA